MSNWPKIQMLSLIVVVWKKSSGEVHVVGLGQNLTLDENTSNFDSNTFKQFWELLCGILDLSSKNWFQNFMCRKLNSKLWFQKTELKIKVWVQKTVPKTLSSKIWHQIWVRFTELKIFSFRNLSTRFWTHLVLILRKQYYTTSIQNPVI